MTATQPLPALNEDPDFLLGWSTQELFTDAIAEINLNTQLSDLAKAEKIDAAWSNACSIIAGAGRDLRARQIARLQYVEALVPLGPNVPADASPADAAVLHSAFRTALNIARDTAANNRGALMDLYLEAERFGDETMRRAALTAAQDAGIIEVVNAWRNAHPELATEFGELAALRDVLSGMSTDALRIKQAFNLPEQPLESRDLPGIRAAAQASIQGRR